MTEVCKKCGEEQTPWKYIEELKGHICFYCYYNELIESEDNENDQI